VEFGIAYFPTHDGVDPSTVARIAEDHGFESLFFSSHTHIPAERRTPFNEGGEMPRKYAHTHDLFVAMTAAAVATTRLRIGSAILLAIQHDPITAAKAIASIDFLSGGRVEVGVGAGWNVEEMENHGTDPRTRMKLMRERVEAMRQIWTHEEATYHGEFVHFDRIWSWPKPAQRPHPPVLVGGMGPTVEQRVLRFGDGWFPNHLEDGSLIPRWIALRDQADRPLTLSVLTMPADPKVLEQYAEAGAHRAVRWLPSTHRGPLERELERWEQAIADLNGA
jgi:probable F420-dependent oxidoreductase